MDKVNLILGVTAVALVAKYLAMGTPTQPAMTLVLDDKRQWIEQICTQFPSHKVKIIQ